SSLPGRGHLRVIQKFLLNTVADFSSNRWPRNWHLCPNNLTRLGILFDFGLPFNRMAQGFPLPVMFQDLSLEAKIVGNLRLFDLGTICVTSLIEDFFSLFEVSLGFFDGSTYFFSVGSHCLQTLFQMGLLSF